MVLPFIVFSALFFLWTKEVLFSEPPKQKTPEEELGDAIAKFLSQGVKPRK